ncbi:MAG TPA: anhydro-N-acetylmuramic acid kinase [Chitinophagales bacterium]|nr:anhydro-N-acetylmuramic acid kinase [Chitinophagales bacterium]
MNTYRAIGLMSGSSLDGLDICYCRFSEHNGAWGFSILHADVVPYPEEWVQKLKHLPEATAKTFCETDAALGHYFGKQVNAFIKTHQLQGQVELITSHGHTVFHFPQKKFTTQVADGAAIAALTGLPVVANFRTTDVAYGGQGTPIVPIGDLHLFSNYRLCLNLGGIANISCKTTTGIIAFDICPANQVLNVLASQMGKEYDENGNLAATGNINTGLLNALNSLAFYSLPYPKSLDNSFSREALLPLIQGVDIPLPDKLRTYTEHIALQIKAQTDMVSGKEKISFSAANKMLATGGGAFNSFLVGRIAALSGIETEVPASDVVKFKEALVIAFMGVLRLHNKTNVLKSVTGAAKDSAGGALYLP